MNYPIQTHQLKDQVLVIDVSNCTGAENNGTFKLEYFLQIQGELRIFFDRPWIVGIADASLENRIDRREEYQWYSRTGWIHKVPAEVYADYFIIEFFQKKWRKGQNCWLVSNDYFREFDLTEQLETHIIRFKFIDGEFLVYNQLLFDLVSQQTEEA